MSICFWHPKFFGVVDLQSHLGFSFGSVQCIYYFLCDSLELFFTKNISSSKLHPMITSFVAVADFARPTPWESSSVQLFCCLELSDAGVNKRVSRATKYQSTWDKPHERLTPPPSCNKGRSLALRQGTGEGTAHGGWDTHPGEENDS